MDNSTIPTSYVYSLLIVEIFWHLVAEIWDLVVKLGFWGGGGGGSGEGFGVVEFHNYFFLNGKNQNSED